jgi:hypothetical protein
VLWGKKGKKKEEYQSVSVFFIGCLVRLLTFIAEKATRLHCQKNQLPPSSCIFKTRLSFPSDGVVSWDEGWFCTSKNAYEKTTKARHSDKHL